MRDLFQEKLMYMYIAFPEDDLYYQYPGSGFGSTAFYANSRAWYLGAVERKGEIFITEPYQDFHSEAWLISITRAIYRPNGDLLAVVGIDYYGSFFFSDISNQQILDTGFAAMISNGGAIVSEVKLWDTSYEVDRVFEVDKTGLDMEDWVEIRDDERNIDETWEFKIPKNMDMYHCVRSYVRDS